jgi:hypothetical protein
MGSSTMKTLDSAGILDFVVTAGKLNTTLPGMPNTETFESNTALTQLGITMSDPAAKIFSFNALRESATSSYSLLYMRIKGR